MKTGGSSSRRAAVFALARWLETANAPQARGALLQPGAVPPEDRAFVQDLVYETVRRRRSLGFLLGLLVKRMPRGEMEAALLCGAAQVFFMGGKVPPFAAVNETVAAAGMAGRRAASFANAVLRNCVRRRDELLARLAEEPLAVRESFPDALASRWIARFGAERAESLCRSMNAPADVWLAYPPPQGFSKLPHGCRIEDVPGYAEGGFIVQDPATAGAIGLLDVRPGMSVLDFCAAPGGKSAQIFWRLGGTGLLTAAETNARRRETLEETLRRVAPGARNVRVCAVPEEGETFDRVLVDAPCSNTGVMRRRPDARWRWSAGKTRSLAALQSELLDRAARHTAPGGILVYSTCSIDGEENEAVADAFARAHPGFAEGETRLAMPDCPGDCDGAFARAFIRR